MQQSTMLVPPLCYGLVEDDLHRAGAPKSVNLPFLKQLGLRTIVSLCTKEPSAPLLEFCRENNVDLVWLGGKEHISAQLDYISEELVVEGLKLLCLKKNRPVLVFDEFGRHRVGTLVGCLRKLQRRSLTCIFEEYRRYSDRELHVKNEQFIELFDLESLDCRFEP